MLKIPGLKSTVVLMIVAIFSSNVKGQDLETVNSVNLDKYVGTWYEIAKIPNRFQKKCARNTTATYTLKENGKIRVVNECNTAEGDRTKATGVARIVDEQTNAKLEVSFVSILGLNLFWGDYWIIGLDEEYDWAVVGTPSRKYGWILSRTPSLADSEMDKIHTILREQGYNPDDFEMTEQDRG
ncbi:MAG: lipocalin family protein [Candidatus Marinimicrobia bacterium]|nr:lipocalin family protein [Candidatus Neomarinimicrobiota bacterium]MCF7827555.1 lipocalin family protein [Candidatus Neomarinimicrobiota bacterium]MCF7881583.1 lipocalin family protein [Candidatus Neomarinimicrobiota bacterium]